MSEPTQVYLIRSVSGEPDWHTVSPLEAGCVLWHPDCGIRAFGRICYDSRYLYVRLSAEEKHIRAEYTEPLSPVHRDSCLEFFFMPEGKDRYFNFEINPNGCLWIGFGRNRQNRSVLSPVDPERLFGIRTERTADGWAVRYRIPLSFLRLYLPDLSFSGKLRANIYKCGDLTEQEHYLSWNPVTSASPDFHRPQDFGMMVFDTEEDKSIETLP